MTVLHDVKASLLMRADKACILERDTAKRDALSDFHLLCLHYCKRMCKTILSLSLSLCVCVCVCVCLCALVVCGCICVCMHVCVNVLHFMFSPLGKLNEMTGHQTRRGEF